MKKTWGIFAAVAVICIGLGVFIGHKQTSPQQADNAAVASLLSQSMPDAHGKPQELSQWKSRPLVVNFWATWCAPCVEEMPELSELQTELDAGKKVQIIGIGIDSPSNIAEFIGKYKIAYPIYVGGLSGTELSRQLGNQAGGLPFTVLIDGNGKVRKSYLGRLKMDELRKDIASL
ncbi:TlpA family protein disulfide reductase [Noviherbaspirillum malthae]|uniref:TlpA family protein disulfide reductase n=1 Tax=Noviherbaspirillum malthae TaxID=1260987 RepID=UPI00189055CA|nr:TlpA disulfide reductase family protein [Noviherbaspirillum malthae]